MSVRVAYESTPAELADAMVSAQRRSPIYRRLHWGVAAVTALVVGMAVWRRAGEELTALGSMLVAVALYHFTSLAINRWYARVRSRAWLGERGSLRTEVEIAAEALALEEEGTRVRIAWSEVTGARDVAGGIEVTGRRGLLALVRDRAFASAAERARFRDEINRHAAGRVSR